MDLENPCRPPFFPQHRFCPVHSIFISYIYAMQTTLNCVLMKVSIKEVHTSFSKVYNLLNIVYILHSNICPAAVTGTV